jgi:hypothetical protein
LRVTSREDGAGRERRLEALLGNRVERALVRELAALEARERLGQLALRQLHDRREQRLREGAVGPATSPLMPKIESE